MILAFIYQINAEGEYFNLSVTFILADITSLCCFDILGIC